jgi:hypothetical protein
MLSKESRAGGEPFAKGDLAQLTPKEKNPVVASAANWRCPA